MIKIDGMIKSGKHDNRIDFLSSVRQQIEEKKHITEKQADAVNMIWSRDGQKSYSKYNRGHARVMR
jgi:hypothetical protein